MNTAQPDRGAWQVREPLGRRRLPFAVVLLAVFLYAAVGVLVTCPVGDSVPVSGDVARVSAVDPLAGSSSCPGCVTAPAVSEQLHGPTSERCPSESPYGHGAALAADPVSRTSEPMPVTAPAAVPSVTVTCGADPVPTSACPTGPVPPAAVREPVAVLCVDRN